MDESTPIVLKHRFENLCVWKGRENWPLLVWQSLVSLQYCEQSDDTACRRGKTRSCCWYSFRQNCDREEILLAKISLLWNMDLLHVSFQQFLLILRIYFGETFEIWENHWMPRERSLAIVLMQRLGSSVCSHTFVRIYLIECSGYWSEGKTRLSSLLCYLNDSLSYWIHEYLCNHMWQRPWCVHLPGRLALNASKTCWTESFSCSMLRRWCCLFIDFSVGKSTSPYKRIDDNQQINWYGVVFSFYRLHSWVVSKDKHSCWYA